MGYATSRGVGQYQATLAHSALYSRLYKPGSARGVIVCGSVNSTDDSWITSDANGQLVAKAVADSGFSLIGTSSDALWGNSAALTRVSNLKTYFQGSLPLAAAGTVDLIGISQGATTALNWAKANPTLVRRIALLVPAVDIQDIYTNDRGSLAAGISAAYGGAPPDASTPAKNAASFTGFTMKIWRATDDPICTPTTVDAFATATGATTASLGAVGHSITALDGQQVAAFLAA
jgi:S-formylglutathione hydrolase FrmB